MSQTSRFNSNTQVKNSDLNWVMMSRELNSISMTRLVAISLIVSFNFNVMLMSHVLDKDDDVICSFIDYSSIQLFIDADLDHFIVKKQHVHVLLFFCSRNFLISNKLSELDFWVSILIQVWWCNLFLYHLHVNSKIDELWTNVMSLHKANHMSVF